VVQLRLSWPSEKAMSQELRSSATDPKKGRVLEREGLRILKPGFDIVEMFHGDGIDVDWGTMKVLEDHNEIEIFQPELKW